MAFLSLRSVYKTYENNKNKTKALKGITLSIDKGEMVAITGKSGCGKTTLLNIIGGLDVMDKGQLIFENKVIDYTNYNELYKYRRDKISFIMQNFALIEDYSLIKNVCLPIQYEKQNKSCKEIKIRNIIDMLQLTGKESQLVSLLSGGERQRVAIARALKKNHSIILADEPTGSIDEENTKIIMEHFVELNKSGQTIMIVTHDQNVAKYCNRTIEMSDGMIINKKGEMKS